ncbi:hypothetical protein MJT46_004650 [Ovis ammon polii x Ovis aries]|nr:hypothetical protein MJT46_004650 [Ovis ammon polii x Ovis aries]
MAFVLSLLMALVLVSYGPGGSLGCVLSPNQVLLGRKNLRLLGEMTRLSPHVCLQDRKDFAFPQEMVEGSQLQEAQAISLLHEMLQQSFNLFHPERASAAWDTTLLEQLRTGLHQQLDDLDACLGQDRKDFAFPQEMVEGGQLQEAQAISLLHEMLQQSFNLFHTERASAAWNTTLLKQLRNGLLDQLVDLDACLGQDMGEEDSALGRTGPTLAVKRYFQGIHVYLQEKGYSDCAWETIRVEIMRSLSSSASL